MKYIKHLFISSVISTLLGCSSGGDSSSESITATDPVSDLDPDSSVVHPEVDPTLFLANALVSSVSSDICTLSNGAQVDCYKFEIAGAPSNHDIGVFCPRNINDTADQAGIWFDGGGEVYDLDGEFIANLASIYQDDKWQLFDENTGNVYVTDTLESCDGAARPNVEAQYQNHCVECAIEYVDGGISQTFYLPVTPVLASGTNALGRTNVGLALNGVVLAAPAPVDAILSAYTIAAFDDCAGHINLHEGYHYHGAAGCVSEQQEQSASMLGYALDGFAIYNMNGVDGTEPDDLDQCRGHSTDSFGYHYHAASIAENMFIGCFSGEVVVQ